MTDVVVFVANGFNKENTRLQPWRYIFEIATQRGKGKSVVIITDGDNGDFHLYIKKRLYLL